MTKTALLGVLALACLTASLAQAQGFNKGSNLNSSGQSKVNKALAKGWASGDSKVTSEGRSVVNIGNKNSGNCTVNVGTTQATKPGQQAPKEVVVTAKEIINVCK